MRNIHTCNTHVVTAWTNSILSTRYFCWHRCIKARYHWNKLHLYQKTETLPRWCYLPHHIQAKRVAAHCKGFQRLKPRRETPTSLIFAVRISKAIGCNVEVPICGHRPAGTERVCTNRTGIAVFQEQHQHIGNGRTSSLSNPWATVNFL